MSLVSYAFWLFVVVAVAIYWIAPQSKRWIVLLAASYIFLLSYGKREILYVMFTTISCYLGAQFMESLQKGPKKKFVLLFCLTLNLTLMAALRQGIFFTNMIVSKMPGIFHTLSLELLVVPLGISYYTLKVAAYLIDIYYGRTKASNHIGKFALYVVFFPELSQGPIEKYQTIYPQFDHTDRINYSTFCRAFYLILWGTVKKLVFSTKIGELVPAAFSASSALSGYQILLGTMFYSMQLYADFSGYMNIVQGVSELFGIKIASNFNLPYFSESIEEFWHRWHMTMGAWFREYIFYPFSTSKLMKKFGKVCRKRFGNTNGKKYPIYLSLFVTWLATGLWHGGTSHWMVWGLLNGFLIALGIQFRETIQLLYTKLKIEQNHILLKIWRTFRTFVIVSFLRIFSYSSDLQSAWAMVKTIFTRFFEKPEFHYWEASCFGLAITGCIAIVIGDLVELKRISINKKRPFHFIVQWVLAYAGLILIFMFLGKETDFLYARF